MLGNMNTNFEFTSRWNHHLTAITCENLKFNSFMYVLCIQNTFIHINILCQTLILQEKDTEINPANRNNKGRKINQY